jgi:hypothetical protein
VFAMLDAYNNGASKYYSIHLLACNGQWLPMASFPLSLFRC